MAVGSIISEQLNIEVSGTRENSVETEPYELTAYALHNFKAFRDSGWIELKPLTLFVGDNSAGKSVLYQALKMLKFANDSIARESVFEDLCEMERLVGNFADVCNKNVDDQDVVFDFRFVSKMNPMQVLIYSVHLRKAVSGDYGMVNTVDIREKEECWDLLDYYESYNLFFLIKKDHTEIPLQLEGKVRGILDALRKFANSIQAVTAHRAVPERIMQLTGTKPKDLGEDGNQSYNYLYALSELENDKKIFVNNWLGKFGYEYCWKAQGKNRGEFMLRNNETGKESNIVDNGFGISQSLPIAVFVAAANGETLLIDSPEAFLQTRLQSELGDLLIAGSQKGTLMVETGSEYVLFRIRRRIAEGIISAEKVALCFVEDDENGDAICNKVGIDETGELINMTNQFRAFFSSDFFDMERMDEIKRQKYK